MQYLFQKKLPSGKIVLVQLDLFEDECILASYIDDEFEPAPPSMVNLPMDMLPGLAAALKEVSNAR